MGRRHAALAVLLSAVCAIALANGVFVSFDAHRIKVIQGGPVESAALLVVPVDDDRARDLTTPFALIARIENLASSPRRFLIRSDEHDVCEAVVPPGATRRVDCVVRDGLAGAASRRLTIASETADPWRLDYLELATHHGRTTGVIDAVVLPPQSTYVTRPPWWSAVLVWVLLTTVFLRPAQRFQLRALRLTYQVVVLLIVGIFIVAAAATLVSPFRVALSLTTFVLFTGILAAGHGPRVPVRRIRVLAWRAVKAAGRGSRRTIDAIFRVPPGVIACALAAAVCALGAVYGSRAIGGADEYGYVSEAELWLHRDLKIEQPFVAGMTWPAPGTTMAPLGYRAFHADDRIIVPIYSPGLPMALAAVKAVAGHTAIFLVVPFCSALLVLITYGIGVRLGMRAAGLIGAWLVATSPTVLFMVMLAMTDIPVAVAWAGAIFLMLGITPLSAAGAGALAGAAVLIRPNLAPLVAVLGAHYAWNVVAPGGPRRAAIVRLAAFSVATLPGIAAVALIYQHLYGSPFESGYGRTAELYVLSRIPENLRLYTTWLVQSHTLLALCGLAAALLPLRVIWGRAPERSALVTVAVFTAAVWLSYCAWAVFDAWWFTRFLLATWPFIMLGVGAVLMHVVRAPIPGARVMVAVFVVVVGVVQFRFGVSHGVFALGDANRRFIGVSQMVQRTTGPRSVVFSLDFSGSIRYYGGRMTLNYSQLDEDRLDEAVTWFTQRGVRAYAALAEIEVAAFKERFAPAVALRSLDYPVAMYENPGKTFLFELSTDAAAHTGTSVQPVIERDARPGWFAVPPVAPPSLVLAP